MYFWFGAYLNYGTVVKKELLENTFKETIIFFFYWHALPQLNSYTETEIQGHGFSPTNILA